MRILLIIFLISFPNFSLASINDIINNLNKTNNFNFKFIQKMNGKIQSGECTVEYPKKIFCKYNDKNNKILVSNGKSLIITSDRHINYTRYNIKKTPLNIILDKKFLLSEIKKSNHIDLTKNTLIMNFFYENNEITIFFDRKNFDIKGWKILDIYQNVVETKISDIKKNLIINDKLFDYRNYVN